MVSLLNKVITRVAAIGCLVLMAGIPATAQGLFSTAIKVNDQAISTYELRQRAAFLSALNAPGNPRTLAKEQLIDDRLKIGAARQLGVSLSQEQIDQAVASFAQNNNRSVAEMLAILAADGVAKETLEDFVSSGLLWREVVRIKFASQAQISDEQLDRAANSSASGTSVRVLLSEIIMPMQPGFENDVMALADEISQIRSTATFSDYARQYSAVPTRDQGGRLEWQALDKLPPVLQPIIFDLKPGEVTAPLSLPNAVALFQLRSMQEGRYAARRPSAYDVAVLTLINAQDVAQVETKLDSCDDLYAHAKNLSGTSLSRDIRQASDVPSALRAQLERLDQNEYSITSTAQQTTITMLCSRVFQETTEAPDLEQLRTGLRNKRLESLANSYLENLRQDARIIEK